jgi:hypothetical protein
MAELTDEYLSKLESRSKRGSLLLWDESVNLIAEIRRLRASEAECVAALRAMWRESDIDPDPSDPDLAKARDNARAVLVKHGKGTT